MAARALPPSPARDPSRSSFVLASLGAGALLALVPVALGPWDAAGPARRAAPPPPLSGAHGRAGGPLLWACDRDGGRVVRLDRDLFVVDSRRLPRPLRVAPLADGGAWVACAVEGRPRGAHRLVHLDRGLREVASLELGPVLDLAAGRGGEALVLERPAEGAERVLWIELGEASPATLLELPGARALASSEGWVAAGDGGGRLELWGPGAERATAWLPGALGPIAAAPGGWWVVAQGGALLVRLTLGGSLVASADLTLASARLAPAGDGGLWLSDERGVRIERRDAAGALVFGRDLRQAVALGALAEWGPPMERGRAEGGSGEPGGADRGRGGAVVAGIGALLAVGPGGELRRGQGGFERLVDLARFRREEPAFPGGE